jgi:hypothetical protein
MVHMLISRLVYVDGPHILVAPEPQSNLVSIDRPPPTTIDDPELLPRAWWRANEERTTYFGVDESLTFLREFLQKQEKPFDVSGPFEVHMCINNIPSGDIWIQPRCSYGCTSDSSGARDQLLEISWY